MLWFIGIDLHNNANRIFVCSSAPNNNKIAWTNDAEIINQHCNDYKFFVVSFRLLSLFLALQILFNWIVLYLRWIIISGYLFPSNRRNNKNLHAHNKNDQIYVYRKTFNNTRSITTIAWSTFLCVNNHVYVKLLVIGMRWCSLMLLVYFQIFSNWQLRLVHILNCE